MASFGAGSSVIEVQGIDVDEHFDVFKSKFGCLLLKNEEFDNNFEEN